MTASTVTGRPTSASWLGPACGVTVVQVVEPTFELDDDEHALRTATESATPSARAERTMRTPLADTER